MNNPFDRQLARGAEAYEDVLGRWWHNQSGNAAHARAYRKIASYMGQSFGSSPDLIVDYACGEGSLLLRLAKQFPGTRIVGVDGSGYLLNLARKRLGRRRSSGGTRLSLARTCLPNLDLRFEAALAVFAFPNMVPDSRVNQSCQISLYFGPDDLRSAREIASHAERDLPRNHTVWALLWNRLVSLNLRRMLRRGGHCVRVEYGSLPRDQMSRAELLRAGFEEGSLDFGKTGKARNPWFRVSASAYFRSGVMEDVRQQSGDETGEKGGGYQITVLRAV